MAELNGVQKVNDNEIIYGCTRYVKTEDTAQVGDIVVKHCDYYEVVPDTTGYTVSDAVDGVSIIGDDDEMFVYHRYPVFRKTTATTAELIEKKRAELAQLEAQLADELFDQRPKTGDFAITLEDETEFGAGSVVKIIEAEPVDYEGDLPFLVRAVLGKKYTWIGDCKKITPTEAKAALLSQVEALFND